MSGFKSLIVESQQDKFILSPSGSQVMVLMELNLGLQLVTVCSLVCNLECNLA